MIFTPARISSSTQNLEFRLHTFFALAQMRFMLRYKGPGDVLSRTGRESDLKHLGKQWESE